MGSCPDTDIDPNMQFAWRKRSLWRGSGERMHLKMADRMLT